MMRSLSRTRGKGEVMSRIITRRTAVAGLAAAASLPVRRAHADLSALEAAARKEGSLTWYTAQMSGEAAEDMGRTFTRKYPGISVTVIRTTGQVAYQRVLQELKTARRNATCSAPRTCRTIRR
jgi:iron(III) transport system substrate-binding protein